MRARKLDHDLDEHMIHALLANWARWARGWPDRVGYHTLSLPCGPDPENLQPESVPPISEDAATAIESVLVRMRAQRPKLWRAVWYTYVCRYTDQTASTACHITRDEYRARVLRAYAWVDAVLANAHIRA